MKETFYFTHDYNAQSDPKIENMMFDKGWEGYGIYWALIERLAQEPTHKIRTYYERIAFALRTNETLLKSIIEDYQLFSLKDGFFWSNRLLSHFIEREAKSERAKESISKRWAKEASKNTNVSKTYYESDTIKERKGKESKGKRESAQPKKVLITEEEREELVLHLSERYPNHNNLSAELDKFISYWTEPNNSGKERWQCEKFFDIKRRLATWFSNVKTDFKSNDRGGLAIYQPSL